MSGDGNSGSDLAIQLANLLKTNINPTPQNPKLSDNLQINLKLNNQNYALWTGCHPGQIKNFAVTLNQRTNK